MGCKVFFLRTQLEEDLIVLCDGFCDIKDIAQDMEAPMGRGNNEE